jgi:UDPglucose 6-dehydrogenase
VLGAAFKPNSDDVRDSPALDIAQAARAAGGRVTVHDPKAIPNAQRTRPDLDYAHTVEEACKGADVVLHLTEWQEYRDLDPAVLKTVVATPAIIDGRNALDADAWRAAGWTYRALGRPHA